MEAVFDSWQEALESSNLVVLALWAGEYSRCLPLFEAEVAEAESLGRLARAVRAWCNVAGAQAPLGRLGEASQAFERARALAARSGAPIGAVLFAQQVLCTALDEGWEEVAATFGALSASTSPALAWALGHAYATSAQAAARLGRADDALIFLGRLLPWLERAPAWTIGFPIMACGAAETLWFLDRLDHADVIERALREKLLPADFRCAMTEPRLALARLCALQGRHDEALSRFAEARRVLAEQGARPLLAIADYDEALMYVRRGDPGDLDRARLLLDAARRQFDAIGMSGWVRRADELDGRL
jgi:tetratricopeptide (TPR) repeat protein